MKARPSSGKFNGLYLVMLSSDRLMSGVSGDLLAGKCGTDDIDAEEVQLQCIRNEVMPRLH